MSTFVLRHGALPPNPQGRFIGAQDIPLSAVGIAQAHAWAQWWQHKPLAGIVCSDLVRCVETARIIGRARGLPLQYDASLREICLGDWEGLTKHEVEIQFPGQYAARGKDMACFRPRNGESFADLAQRVLPAFDYWQSHFDAAPWLLVGHAGGNRGILARHLALPLAYLLDIPQPYACCTAIASPKPEPGSARS